MYFLLGYIWNIFLQFYFYIDSKNTWWLAIRLQVAAIHQFSPFHDSLHPEIMIVIFSLRPCLAAVICCFFLCIFLQGIWWKHLIHPKQFSRLIHFLINPLAAKHLYYYLLTNCNLSFKCMLHETSKCSISYNKLQYTHVLVVIPKLVQVYWKLHLIHLTNW